MRLVPALFALLGTAAFAQPQPAPLSERQKERIAQQERLIACNKQAREAGMRSSQRQEFIRGCLQRNGAAAGGGRER